LNAFKNRAAKKINANENPRATTNRDKESPKTMELPGWEGDRNIPLKLRREQSAVKKEYARITFWELLAFCIKTPACPCVSF
jgi:hypothetical protein